MKQHKNQDGGNFWNKVRSIFTLEGRNSERIAEKDKQQSAESEENERNTQTAKQAGARENESAGNGAAEYAGNNVVNNSTRDVVYNSVGESKEQEWSLEESANLTYRYLPIQKYISRMGKSRSLAEKLDNLVIKKKLYLDPQLSLTKLSVLMGINRTYMSNVLKEKNGFKNYVNSLRLEYFCGLLKEFPEDQIITKKTITKLALKSGFADLRTFKKLVMDEGNSWSSYIKQRIYSPLQVLEEEQKQQLYRMAEYENFPPQ